jgi:predicted membrane protein
MSKFWKILFASIASILLLLFCVFRNHIRQQICKNFSVSESQLVIKEELNELNFKVEVYDISRTYRNKWVARYNYFFQGANHDFNFSSIPFRSLWFNLNSPYYMEAELK